MEKNNYQLFFQKIIALTGLKEKDKILYIYKNEKFFLNNFIQFINKDGYIYSIVLNKKVPNIKEKNISFHSANENLDLESETLDLIFIEDTKKIDFIQSFNGIKKYLTKKGKIIIYKKKRFFDFLNKDKKIQESMFLTGFRLKNRLEMNNFSINLYEKE